MYSEEILSIWLTEIFLPNNIRLTEMLSEHNNIQKLVFDLRSNKIKNLLPEEADRIRKISYSYAEDINKFCNKNKIQVITLYNEKYPKRLKELLCPPLVIYCMGNEESLDSKKSLAIIGARHPSDYSVKCAEYFSKDLSENDFTIISGLANGIDSVAHNGCLNYEHGKTVAVLGSGILYDYPKNSLPLKNRISKNGAVISEYPPLKEPQPIFFKARNRLISGLSDGILVIEAGIKSGSLNTVSHGLEQGKDIYVIPPADIFNSRYKGQNLLISDGAKTVTSPHEISSTFF